MGEQDQSELLRGEQLINKAVDQCKKDGWPEHRILDRVKHAIHKPVSDPAEQGRRGSRDMPNGDDDSMVGSAR